jgi:hypothetical protein
MRNVSPGAVTKLNIPHLPELSIKLLQVHANTFILDPEPRGTRDLFHFVTTLGDVQLPAKIVRATTII